MNSINRFFQLSLTGMLASGYIAIAGAGYLSIYVLLMAATALLLKTVLILSHKEVHIPDSWVTLSTGICILFLIGDYLWLSQDFLTVTVHLVIFLAIVKLFTARTRRDFFYLQVISFLEILAASMLSTSASFFIGLAMFLFFAVATFASAEIRRSGTGQQIVIHGERRVNWRLSALTGSVTLGILCLASVMFFLLPRTARAAFQHLIAERYHIAGFSNEVNLGRIGELKQRQTPVAHIRTLDQSGGIPPMYWRGSALRTFDGRRWINPPADTGEMLRPQGGGLIQLASDDQRRREGKRMVYEVNLQTMVSDTIFVAGIPEFLQINSPYIRRMSDDGLKTAFNTQNGARYVVYSYLNSAAEPAALTHRSRIEHLILPPVDPRVIELARSLGTPDAIQRHLRSSYGYTLALPETLPEDPTAYFLFERKQGHCEYFASAMAVMLRVLNVPSRVVTGFSGGIRNEISGWHVLRTADAHSWVEAWIEGRGWVVFDPTPADPNAASFGIQEKWSMWVDALDTFWKDWVLGYSLEQQLSIVSRVEQKRMSFDFQALPFQKIGLWVGAGLILIGLWFVIPRKWNFAWKRRLSIHEAERMYDQLLKILKKRGVERPAWMTPQEFAHQFPAAPWRDSAVKFTQAYYDFRFGGRTEAASEMQALLKQVRKSY